jgi:hypothetical protein
LIYWVYPDSDNNNMLAQVPTPLDLNAIQEGAFGVGNSIPTTIGGAVTTILPYIFSIAGILLLLYLLMGGFQLMLSGGEPKKAQGAQGKITNALLGFFIIFIAYWVTQLIGKIFVIPAIGDIFKK